MVPRVLERNVPDGLDERATLLTCATRQVVCMLELECSLNLRAPALRWLD
jgi:hypothetical protein